MPAPLPPSSTQEPRKKPTIPIPSPAHKKPNPSSKANPVTRVALSTLENSTSYADASSKITPPPSLKPPSRWPSIQTPTSASAPSSSSPPSTAPASDPWTTIPHKTKPNQPGTRACSPQKNAPISKPSSPKW